MTICESCVVRIPTTRSRVDCGFGLVMLSFSPTMRLRSVDFPTFGFPATVTIPAHGMTESYCRWWTNCGGRKIKDRRSLYGLNGNRLGRQDSNLQLPD